VDNEILEILKQMQKDQQEMKADIKSINGRLDRIESDIKDIKVDTGSIKVNIKETREDARSSELATAQNSFEIAQIKMRMKMA
jgi:septal ring factor EnvC (AmiA/AmiB activator)